MKQRAKKSHLFRNFLRLCLKHYSVLMCVTSLGYTPNVTVCRWSALRWRLNLKCNAIFCHFEFASGEKLGKKLQNYRDDNVFEKLRFQFFFPSKFERKAAFSNFSGLKSVFEKFRFLDGLMWTVGLTLETKLRFTRCSVSSS